MCFKLSFRFQTALYIGILLTASMVPARADEVDLYREKVIAWAQQIHSIAGRYTLKQIDHSTAAKTNADYRPEKDFSFEYKYQTGDIFLQRIDLNPDGSPARKITEAFLDGKLSQRLDRIPNSQEIPAGEVVLNAADSWPHPPYLCLMPHELFLQPHDEFTLCEALASGRSYIRKAGASVVLSHWTNDLTRSAHIDIYFDVEGRIQEIVNMNRFGVGSIEELKTFWPDDPDTFGVPQDRFEFFNYVDIDGVLFPLDVRYTAYKLGNPEVARLIDAFNGGEISDQDYMSQMMRAFSRDIPLIERIFQFSLDGARINQQLDPSEFRIEFGPNDIVGDAEKSLYGTRIPTWRESLFKPWALALECLTGCILFCVVLWGYRRFMAS